MQRTTELRPRRAALLREVCAPRTVSQLARRLQISRDHCSDLLQRARSTGYVICVNSGSPRTRVYAPTARTHKQIHGQVIRLIATREPGDWRDYAFVASRHRLAVVIAMEGPMQAAAIKRRARYLNPNVRMSANNVRDVLRALLGRGVVRVVLLRNKAHRRFELTPKGLWLQEQLRRAETSTH